MVMLVNVVITLLIKSLVRHLNVSDIRRLCKFLTALSTIFDTADKLLRKFKLIL